MAIIGDLEKHILGTILGKGNSASGFDIREMLLQEAGRKVSIGALYTSLDRLETKGFIRYSVGEGCSERGNRPQRFFYVTGEGRLALSEAYRMDQAVYGFAGLSEVLP